MSSVTRDIFVVNDMVTIDLSVTLHGIIVCLRDWPSRISYYIWLRNNLLSPSLLLTVFCGFTVAYSYSAFV